MAEAAEDDLNKSVGGENVTFRVYIFLLKTGKGSVREIYRRCDLSTPSLALHHLKKLEGLNLVRKDENGIYHAVPKRFGILRFFYKVGIWLLPRSFFYMILYASIAITSLIFLPSGMREVGIAISGIGFATNLFESVLFLRLVH